MLQRLSLLMLLACLLAYRPAGAQEAPAWNVRPTYSYEKSVIAVVRFNANNTGLEMETLPRIIRNDLTLSGFFENVKDQMLANRQNMVDHNRKNIAFEAWAGMGVKHYLMGNVSEDATSYKVQVLVYDIDSKRLILSRDFVDRKERIRDLAHQISDAVILQIKGIEGVCRTRLLFVTEQVPGVKEIATMDWDGFGARPITNLGKLATTPVWGANGTEIYFTSYHGNRANVYGMQLTPDAALKLNPGQMWTIAAYGGTNHSPEWNSAARRLALVLSKDGNSEIYTASRDGKSATRVTTTKATEGSPCWSPDGSKIAFTSNEAGGVHVFVMNADGSGKRRLTTLGSWNDEVSWSPDGRRIAFVSRRAGANDIYICDAEGDKANLRRLTMNQGNNEAPAWAPNGTHLAFSSNRSGQWQIWMMLDDGSNQLPLTSAGRNTSAAWGPFLAKN